MLLRQFMLNVGPLESNAWLFADEHAGNVILIDAGAFDASIAALVDERKLNLSHIVLTHHHWDHVDGLPEFFRVWPAAKLITPAPMEHYPDAQVVSDGEMINLGGIALEIVRTSGHTPESVSYYCRGAEVCFVGDAIFAGSVGGTKSDELFEEQRGNLLRLFEKLQPATELCPGHGPATTVMIEQAANPFLKPGFGR